MKTNAVILFLFSLLIYSLYQKNTAYVSFLNTDRTNENIKTIFIPSIDLSLSVKKAPLENKEWIISESKNAFFGQGSSYPLQDGTTVIFAHARYKLFALLPLLKKDDAVVLTTKNRVFVYKIYDRKLFSPSDTSFIIKRNRNILALFTCYGQHDAQRIIFFAYPINSYPKKIKHLNLYSV